MAGLTTQMLHPTCLHCYLDQQMLGLVRQLSKHEDLSLDPQHVCKSRVWWCVPLSLVLNRYVGRGPGSVRDHVQKKKNSGKQSRKTHNIDLWSSQEHAHRYMCTYPHKHVHNTHTYTHAHHILSRADYIH